MNTKKYLRGSAVTIGGYVVAFSGMKILVISTWLGFAVFIIGSIIAFLGAAYIWLTRMGACEYISKNKGGKK